MKRLLVVQQYRLPGSFQDRQRGPMYAPLLRGAGYESRYLGRHPMPILQSAHSRMGRAWANSLPTRAWGRLRDRIVTPLSDRRILASARKSDIVLLLKVDDPRLVRRLRRATPARLVFDLADTIWLDARRRVRPDMVEMLKSVDAITFDNSHGEAFAKSMGPPVHRWPSTSYVERFDEHRSRSRRGKDDRIVLGWIGSHTTAYNLFLILESLEEVAKRYPNVELRLLGIPPRHELLSRFERLRVTHKSLYTTEEMVHEVLDMDVALYPMFDLEESAMHGTTKGVIYMGGGAPVIASPISDCRALIQPGSTGFLAASRAEWTSALERLVQDAELRRRVGDAGLQHARTHHSLASCGAALVAALEAE